MTGEGTSLEGLPLGEAPPVSSHHPTLFQLGFSHGFLLGPMNSYDAGPF